MLALTGTALMIKQRFDVERHEYGYKAEHGLPLNIITRTESHDRIYQTMRRIDDILTLYGVKYFVIAGSALGMERHGGIIPWDDDIDIGVVDIREAVCAIKKEWPDVRIEDKWFGGVQIDGCVDLFHMVRGPSDHRIKYREHRAKLMWPREYFEESEVIDVERRKFGPLQLCASPQNLAYVKRAYGPDCLENCFVKTPHDVSVIKRVLIYINPLIKKNFSIKIDNK